MDVFWYIPIILGVMSSLIFGSILYYGYSLSEDVKNKWSQVSLEEISCEIVAGKKMYIDKVDLPLGYDFDKIIKVLKQKWDAMDCTNESSSYWRGEDWAYHTPQPPKIDLFKEYETEKSMDDLYDSWEKKP